MKRKVKRKLTRYRLGSYRHYSESFPDQYCDVPSMVEDEKGEWVKYGEDATRTAKNTGNKFRLEERLGQEYRRAEGLREGVERLYQTLLNHPPPARENGIEYCQAWQSFQTEVCGQLRSFLDTVTTPREDV